MPRRSIRFGDYAINSQTKTKHYITKLNPTTYEITLDNLPAPLIARNGQYYSADEILFTFSSNMDDSKYIERDWVKPATYSTLPTVLHSVKQIIGNLFVDSSNRKWQIYDLKKFKGLDAGNSLNSYPFITDNGNVVIFTTKQGFGTPLNLYEVNTNINYTVPFIPAPNEECIIVSLGNDDVMYLHLGNLHIFNLSTLVQSYNTSITQNVMLNLPIILTLGVAQNPVPRVLPIYLVRQMCQLKGSNHTQKVLAVNINIDGVNTMSSNPNGLNDPRIKLLTLSDTPMFRSVLELLNPDGTSDNVLIHEREHIAIYDIHTGNMIRAINLPEILQVIQLRSGEIMTLTCQDYNNSGLYVSLDNWTSMHEAFSFRGIAHDVLQITELFNGNILCTIRAQPDIIIEGVVSDRAQLRDAFTDIIYPSLQLQGNDNNLFKLLDPAMMRSEFGKYYHK